MSASITLSEADLIPKNAVILGKLGSYRDAQPHRSSSRRFLLRCHMDHWRIAAPNSAAPH
jgi:hypothetical protein